MVMIYFAGDVIIRFKLFSISVGSIRREFLRNLKDYKAWAINLLGNVVSAIHHSKWRSTTSLVY